jgi:hypothetical protein
MAHVERAPLEQSVTAVTAYCQLEKAPVSRGWDLAEKLVELLCTNEKVMYRFKSTGPRRLDFQSAGLTALSPGNALGSRRRLEFPA